MALFLFAVAWYILSMILDRLLAGDPPRSLGGVVKLVVIILALVFMILAIINFCTPVNVIHVALR